LALSGALPDSHGVGISSDKGASWPIPAGLSSWYSQCSQASEWEGNVQRLIEFKLDPSSQTTVLVEADDSIPAAGQTRVSTGGILTDQASKAFDTALAGIRPIVSSVTRQVVEAVNDAQEIEVELGFKLTADAGVILARASAESHCKLSIKWVRKP
jgi:hypothetical protein